ncbi:hypothetical protein BHM03_00018265 [Ensete ventricosum]|nr:hypothetical protein BHM03_00018265 [Ensete ventricosum]
MRGRMTSLCIYVGIDEVAERHQCKCQVASMRMLSDPFVAWHLHWRRARRRTTLGICIYVDANLDAERRQRRCTASIYASSSFYSPIVSPLVVTVYHHQKHP